MINIKNDLIEIKKRNDELRLIHIISRGNKWAIIRRPNTRATKLFEFRDEAYHYSRTIGDRIVVHNKNGDVDFTFGI